MFRILKTKKLTTETKEYGESENKFKKAQG